MPHLSELHGAATHLAVVAVPVYLLTLLVRRSGRGGTALAEAGRQAFSTDGRGCASCHGDQAKGLRGPALAGGVELQEFRSVHGHGLFPPSVVKDADFAAINAWLKTLPDTRRESR
jgi:mono/diheme cytochrome c family protein